MTPRVTTEFWVGAYRRRLEAAFMPVYVVSKGDPEAGAVLVKIALLDGRATVFARAYGADGARIWAPLVELAPESEADAAIDRQRGFDPDLWVIEVEDRDGAGLLDREGLG